MSASDTALATATATLPAAPAYIAPPIPSSFKTSLIAWWKANPVQDSAHAELHLYRNTGYFEGATVNNVECHDDDDVRNGKGLAKGLASLRTKDVSQSTEAGHSSHFHLPHFWPFRSQKEPSTMTMAATPAADGKVGCIRLVDIGSTTRSELDNDEPQMPEDYAETGGLNDNLELAPTHDGVKPCVPPSGRKLNMLEIGLPYSDENEEKIKGETKIVLAHGYGAGSAFFFQNLRSMAQVPNSRLYVLDWLGMGRSSRPTFHIPSAELKTVDSRVEAAESFFVSSLEDWRHKMGLEKMVLVGHSLGGYLSLAYALKYPRRVERLILVSPVGIPAAPVEDQSGTPTFAKKSNSAVDQEIKQPQTDVAPSTVREERKDAASANDMAKRAAQNRAGVPVESHSERRLDRVSTSASVDSATVPRSGQSTQPEKGSHEPPRFSKRARSVFGFLWEQNVSPFGILRTSLFFGPMLAGRYTSRRFGALPDDELRSLHAYCQSIFLSKGSGEYCLAHILQPGAFARKPMVDRIDGLKMPMSFLYGEQDWMDVRGGKEAVKRLRKQGNTKTNCFVVPNSGHHIYLDNPKPYDTLIFKILKGEADPQ